MFIVEDTGLEPPEDDYVSPAPIVDEVNRTVSCGNCGSVYDDIHPGEYSRREGIDPVGPMCTWCCDSHPLITRIKDPEVEARLLREWQQRDSHASCPTDDHSDHERCVLKGDCGCNFDATEPLPGDRRGDLEYDGDGWRKVANSDSDLAEALNSIRRGIGDLVKVLEARGVNTWQYPHDISDHAQTPDGGWYTVPTNCPCGGGQPF